MNSKQADDEFINNFQNGSEITLGQREQEYRQNYNEQVDEFECDDDNENIHHSTSSGTNQQEYATENVDICIAKNQATNYNSGFNNNETNVKCKPKPADIMRDKSLKWRCVREKKSVKKILKTSLGSPVGVSYGSYGLKYLEPDYTKHFLQGYATCLIAFGEIFLTPEHEWTTIIINRILEEGKLLLQFSRNGEFEMDLTESIITKRFVLCKNTMELEINQPLFVGKVRSIDVTIPNLKDSLHKFFIKNHFGILWIGQYYMLIWRCMRLYFCFDCYGRDPKNCEMNRDNGLASLVCVRTTDNLFHLISELSAIEATDMFTIRKIQMTKLIKCCENADHLVEQPRQMDYKILHERYAILRGHLHLGSYCFREFRFKQSLAVAVIALIYSKIDASCTWDKTVLDQVLIIGTKFYKKWTYCDHSFDLGIQDIPAQFTLGQFTVDIAVKPIRECGNWICLPNYRQSVLCKAIKRSFDTTNNLLVQIERKTYALWRRNDIYYILDPYEHQKIGEDQQKTATLHMCSTLNSLCCVFTQISMEIPTARPFYIHHMKILSIIKTIKLNARNLYAIDCSCITKRPDIEDIDEVLSMNESVEDFQCKREFKCMIENGEIEEDIVADLDSPGLSETQIIPHYEDVKVKMLALSEDDDDVDDEEAKFISLSDSNTASEKSKKCYQSSKKKGERKRAGGINQQTSTSPQKHHQHEEQQQHQLFEHHQLFQEWQEQQQQQPNTINRIPSSLTTRTLSEIRRFPDTTNSRRKKIINKNRKHANRKEMQIKQSSDYSQTDNSKNTKENLMSHAHRTSNAKNKKLKKRSQRTLQPKTEGTSYEDDDDDDDDGNSSSIVDLFCK